MASNVTAPIPRVSGLEFGLSYGAGYLSVVFSGMFYGVACLQTFGYFRSANARTDPWGIKALVVWMLVVDSLQQAADIHIFYYYLIIKRYTLDLGLDQPNVWSIPTTTLLTAIAATTTDSFLTYRVWRLSRNLFMTALCSALTLASTIASIIFHVQEFTHLHRTLIETQTDLQYVTITSIALTAAADLTIAGTMAYYLLRNRTGLRRSNAVIMRLITLSITTGAISALFALATLASFFDKLAIIVFYPLTGKIYSNTFITLLNVRAYMAGIWDNSDWNMNSIHLSQIPDVESFHPSTRSAVQVPPPVSVFLESHVESDGDSDGLKLKVCSRANSEDGTS